MNKNCFIMIDGIDGSGKDTIANIWKEKLTAEGNAIFDVRDYWKEKGTYPDFNELKSYDFIFTAEPTYVGVGKVIRDEFIKNGTHYPNLAIAHAYALDRIVHYEKIVIPALQDGKCVIMVRGVSTSLCYQALSGELSLSTLAALPGNTVALENRPDHLILLSITPEQALSRLPGRFKNDNAIFEKQDFLEKATAFFNSKPYQDLFTSRGTQIQQLPSHEDPATMKERALKLLTTLL
jgi:dTMP kinase